MAGIQALADPRKSLHLSSPTDRGEGACREGLSGAQLVWRPPIDGANSAYVIAAHTLGNARAWVLGIACGKAVERDRPAEFRASGRDAADLLAHRRELCGQ